MEYLKKHILLAGFALLMAGCAADDAVTGEEGSGTAVADMVGQPVMFAVGNVAEGVTRAAIPYMQKDGRFVCTMYYHALATDTKDSDYDIKQGGTATTAWLKVNNTTGNSVYRLASFDETSMDLDTYDFDRNATIFFWQNRLPHAFLALADYNQLETNDGATTGQGKLKMFPNHDKDLLTLPVNPTDEQQEVYNSLVSDRRYVNEYDLTKGTKEKITQQPDPILALTVMTPAGATQEANRVELYFKHQFSQIQVNLKGANDNSADIKASQIESVELLGVSETGYVYSRLNKNGTIGEATGSGTALTRGAAFGKDVQLDQYTDAQLAENRWGTSFSMFDMATGVIEDGHDTGYAIGFLKSYNAIAFGHLSAIRIKWREEETDIVHTSTFEVPAENEEHVNLRQLASGMKYIYDLELRRGTLAVIRTQIIDWNQKSDLVYGADGTISNK